LKLVRGDALRELELGEVRADVALGTEIGEDLTEAGDLVLSAVQRPVLALGVVEAVLPRAIFMGNVVQRRIDVSVAGTAGAGCAGLREGLKRVGPVGRSSSDPDDARVVRSPIRGQPIAKGFDVFHEIDVHDVDHAGVGSVVLPDSSAAPKEHPGTVVSAK
jgi:hypothetical protein